MVSVNVDVASECSPDVVWELEKTPWPWESDSADSVLFSHSLEHIGADPRVLRGSIRGLYRMCVNSAELLVKVPHPRHDDFITDPTHVRVITRPCSVCSANGSMLSGSRTVRPTRRSRCTGEWISRSRRSSICWTSPTARKWRTGQISSDQITAISRERNNVVKEISIHLVAVK